MLACIHARMPVRGLHSNVFAVTRSCYLLKASRLFFTHAVLRNIADPIESLQEITTLYPGLSIADSNPYQRANARLE